MGWTVPGCYDWGMSIPVALPDLREAAEPYGFAYLLTVSDGGRPHAVAVTPEFSGDAMTVTTGRRTATNAAARPAVSLVYPPVEPGGYSLIVDAEAAVVEQTVTLSPATAVLHRPAPAGEGAAPGADVTGSCGSDCLPVGSVRAD